MNIATEVKRCIEVLRGRGFKIEVRPPPPQCVETLKRRLYTRDGHIITDSRKIKLSRQP